MLTHMLVNISRKALPGKRQYFHLIDVVPAGAGIVIQIGAAILKLDNDKLIADLVGRYARIFCRAFIGLHA